MNEVPGRGPDVARCFGRYRAQTPQYALSTCVHCPRLKACVRTAWGLERPRRGDDRDRWWERSPRARAVQRPRPADFAAT